jgi:hypothetical protein
VNPTTYELGGRYKLRTNIDAGLKYVFKSVELVTAMTTRAGKNPPFPKAKPGFWVIGSKNPF